MNDKNKSGSWRVCLKNEKNERNIPRKNWAPFWNKLHADNIGNYLFLQLMLV